MRVDTLASMMFVVVCLVSLLMQIYSLGYMKGDVRYTWYFAAVNLFTGSMLTLVIANNTVQMLVGWELVGVCSYLLIGHWFEEKENSDAAIKAFITTRAGDLGFVLGVIVLFVGAHTFNIGQIQELVGEGDVSTVGRHARDAAAVLRRGRQVGPVPAARLAPGRDGRPDARLRPDPRRDDGHGRRLHGRPHLRSVLARRAQTMTVISIIASITMLLAAPLAVFQRDIKKVLAYSTVSPARLHDGRPRRRRRGGRDLPPLDARVLQGAALPRRRERDPRGAQQRHVRDGRPAEVHADHVRDVDDRLPRARRVPAPRRVLVEGRDRRGGVPDRDTPSCSSPR